MIRRVVTHDVGGRSAVRSDGPADDLWVTSSDQPLGEDPSDGLAVLEPPSGGSRFRVVSVPPDEVMRAVLAAHAVPGVGADGFHRTRTIDYVLVLDGDITLELDDEAIVLHAGDCVVQRGTNHAWRNLGDSPVRLLAVMIAVDPRTP